MTLHTRDVQGGDIGDKPPPSMVFRGFSCPYGCTAPWENS